MAAAAAVCRVCLSDNVRMINIASSRLEEIFEKITNDKISVPGRPETVCYICCSQLQRGRRLVDTFLRTNKIMEHFAMSGVELTMETISILDRKIPSNYTVTPIEVTNMPKLAEDSIIVKTEVTVKQEPHDPESEIHDEEIEGASSTKKLKIDENKDPDIKPFACDGCDRSFELKSQLNGHKRVHKQKKRKPRK